MRSQPLTLILILSALTAGVFGWKLGNEPAGQTATSISVSKKSVTPVRPKTSAIFKAAPAQTLPSADSIPAEAGSGTPLNQLSDALKTAANKTDCRSIAQSIAALGREDAAEAIWQAAIGQKNPVLRDAILEGLDSVVSPEIITFTASVLKATTDPEILDAAKQLVTRGADMDTVSFLTELYTEEGTTEFQQHHIEHAISTIRTEAAASALGALVQHTDTPRLAEAAAVSLFTLRTPVTMQQLSDARATLASVNTSEAAQTVQAIDRLMKDAPESGSQPEIARALW